MAASAQVVGAKLVEGPSGHPLSEVRLSWRDDGHVKITFKSGPILIVAAALKNPKEPMIRVYKKPEAMV